MAKRILVPLKATDPARSFIETLTGLARGTGATVRLLHVGPFHDSIVGDDGHLVAYADQETQRLEGEARDFMEVVALALDGVPVEFSVRFGDPATEILAEAELFGADLIALPIAPRRRFLAPEGVAGHVLRCATAPVALLSAGHPEVAV